MNANPDALMRAGDVPHSGDDLPERHPHFSSSMNTPPQKPARTGRVIFLVALVLVVAFVAGYLPRLKKRAVVLAESRELAIPTVAIVKAAPAQAPPPLALSGEVKPLAEASIYARANGYVRHWSVDLGAQVKAGDLLAELDTPEIAKELDQARAQLAQAEAAQSLAETTAKRWREMLTGRTVSPQEAEEKAGDLAVKKATVEAARANVKRLEQISGFSQLTAPFAGTITARRVDVGQLVTAASGAELFRLADTSKLRVFVRVPQTYARTVSPGQVAQLTMPELPGREFAAKVVRTAGSLDASTRTLLTELEVENPGGEILAGGFAQVRLPEAKAEALLTLPANTLIFRPDGPQVATVKSGRVTLHKVVLGRDFGSVIEITEGIGAGDDVILNPADSLVDGVEVRTKVNPTPAGMAQGK